ncbi:MAG: FAD-dependent monooxygenase [Anaerolineae bacterium]
MRTQVGVIRFGTAGLLLSQLLYLNGIVDSVILERQSREHVESRIRAGVLEMGTTRLLREAGVGERMDREVSSITVLSLSADGGSGLTLTSTHRRQQCDDLRQTEVTRDLIEARLQAGGVLKYETPAVAIENFLEGHHL